MQIYLAITPGELQEASRHCRNAVHFAHVAYRLGEDSTLLRQNLLVQTRGGLLSISDREAPVISDIEKLCAAVQRECGRRGFNGVLLDFEAPPTQDRQDFAAALGRIFVSSHRALYIPESYAPFCRKQEQTAAIPLICTALSGGSFSERLREAAARYGGAGRLALDIQRLRMDFILPSRTGEGQPLSADAFQKLLSERNPSIFFSPDLCARYFTYNQAGETHFVLFDDAGTLQKKLQFGIRMGFSASFFMFPEVQDILPQLFPNGIGP